MIIAPVDLLAGLFFRKRFGAHRFLGAVFLLQYIASVYLFLSQYKRWLRSPLVWTCPLTGLLQSINAALTFKFLPKTRIPGFAAVADKSVLSYFTVVENSFYAMQLVFACCYLHDGIRPLIQRLLVLEPFFVFFVFWARDLWPSSRVSAALESADKTMTKMNRFTLTASAHSIKGFYLWAKHFVGFFPLYLVFLDRLTEEDKHLMYGVQVLSGHACTVSIFIHTLKFKGYIGPLTAMVAYDIIIPGFLFLYWRMLEVILRNADVAAVCGVALLLNLFPKPTFHVYQAFVAAAFYGGVFGKAPLVGPLSYERGAVAAAGLLVSALAIMWAFPQKKERRGVSGAAGRTVGQAKAA
mmetsp:Transcript_70021/g.226532  ORF Transcript_70021/g.226532 Transcript_70021/m.226532 type:complete len:353 (-) Transcript_70021:44-1102(-)